MSHNAHAYRGGTQFSLPAGTKYAVHCPEHGLFPLSERQYTRQMCASNQTWRCPCGLGASWSDKVYDAYCDWAHGDVPERPVEVAPDFIEDEIDIDSLLED